MSRQRDAAVPLLCIHPLSEQDSPSDRSVAASGVHPMGTPHLACGRLELCRSAGFDSWQVDSGGKMMSGVAGRRCEVEEQGAGFA